jgi:hypothetical protein
LCLDKSTTKIIFNEVEPETNLFSEKEERKNEKIELVSE